MIVRISLIIIAALFLALSLFLINGNSSYVMLLFYLLMSLPIAVLSLELVEKVTYARKTRHMRNLFIESLYVITYYRSKGMPLYKTIIKVAGLPGSQHVKDVLRKLANMMRLGETFNSAAISVCKESGIDVIGDMYANKKGDYDSLVKVLSLHESNVSEQNVRIEQSLQQYSTISMFISTIVPSFVIFAFIGESLLSQGPESLLAFSSVMVLGLPFAYLVWGTFVKRRLLD